MATNRIATGVGKRVAFGAEPAFGIKPASNSGKGVRRVTSTLSLTKDTFESKEIRTDLQVADMRHGVRKVEGEIKGELSPGSYADFIKAALRADSTTYAVVGAVDIAAVADGFTSTVTNFLTEGVRVGDVIRFSGFAEADNNDCNFFVTEASAHAISGTFLIDRDVVIEAAGAPVSVTLVGGKVSAPLTGHIEKSFSIEHFYSEQNESETYKGCKINSVDVNLPPTGIAEISIKLVGQDIDTTVGPFFINPAAALATGVLSAVNGIVFAIGKRQTALTGMQLTINGNVSGDAVVGSNIVPELLSGRIKVTGQLTAYFDGVEMRDAFLAESEVTLFAVFTSSNAPDADFVSFVLPRVKLGGSSKDDGEKGLVQTVPYVALLGSGASGFEATTITVQDSAIA